LYLEADQYPKDGINELGLRFSWDLFWNNHDPHNLAGELVDRRTTGQNGGVVLSLPSLAIAGERHLAAAKNILTIRFLWGDPKFCLNSFLEREQRDGRHFDAVHWHKNNDGAFDILSKSLYAPYRRVVFASDGKRIRWEDVLQKL
jgi:hypothetical protein